MAITIELSIHFFWFILYFSFSEGGNFSGVLSIQVRIFTLMLATVMHIRGTFQEAQGKESICQCRRCRRHRFDSWLGKIPWRRKWQPTSVFLPRRSCVQRCLEGYSLWGHKESNSTQHVFSTCRTRTQHGTHMHVRFYRSVISSSMLLVEFLVQNANFICELSDLDGKHHFWR